MNEYVKEVKTTEFYQDLKKLLKTISLILVGLYILYLGSNNPNTKWFTYAFFGLLPFCISAMNKLVRVEYKTVIEIPEGALENENGDIELNPDMDIGIYQFPTHILQKQNWKDKRKITTYNNRNTKGMIKFCHRVDWSNKEFIGVWFDEMDSIKIRSTNLYIYILSNKLKTMLEEYNIRKEALDWLSYEKAGKILHLIGQLTKKNPVEALEQLLEDKEGLDQFIQSVEALQDFNPENNIATEGG